MLVCSFSFLTATAADTEDEPEYVARMTLGYRDGAKTFEGHAFLYFENLTDHKITIGCYTVGVGVCISVGTFGTMVDGPGLYYNVESYRYNFLKLTDYISLTKLVTAEELEEITVKIKNSGFWNKFFNCTYFAVTTWNIVEGYTMPWLIFPELCNLEIKTTSAHKGYFEMKMPPRGKDSVFKQEGDGDGAKAVHASWHMEADTIKD